MLTDRLLATWHLPRSNSLTKSRPKALSSVRHPHVYPTRRRHVAQGAFPRLAYYPQPYLAHLITSFPPSSQSSSTRSSTRGSTRSSTRIPAERNELSMNERCVQCYLRQVLNDDDSVVVSCVRLGPHGRELRLPPAPLYGAPYGHEKVDSQM